MKLSEATKSSRRARLALFVEHWLKNGMVASQAALAMGAPEASAAITGHRWLRQARDLGIVEKRAQRLRQVMGVNELLARQSEMASSDIGDFLDDDGAVDVKKAREIGKTHLIKSLHTDQHGAQSVELYPADKAQERLMRVHKLLGEPTAQAVAPTVVNVQLLLQQLPTETLRQLADAARVVEAKDVTPPEKT